MERLTYKTNRKYINTSIEQAPPYSIDCDIDTAITKLAEYEDFEEIFRSKMTDITCEFLKDKKEFAKWLDRNKWIAKKCDEYARAEEQDKLPCAVGDTVWYWNKDYDPLEEAPFEGYVSGYEIVSRKTMYIIIVPKITFIPAWNDDRKEKLTIDDFGKAIFFTKEESEAALKKSGG